MGVRYSKARERWIGDATDSLGRRHRVAFKTREQARAFVLATDTTNSQRRTADVAAGLTVAELARQWLTQQQLTLRRLTIKNTERTLELHLLPALGNLPAADLGWQLVYRVLADKLQQKDAPKRSTLARWLAHLSALMTYAMDLG